MTLAGQGRTWLKKTVRSHQARRKACAGHVPELCAARWVPARRASVDRGPSVLTQREKCAPSVLAAEACVSGMFCQSLVPLPGHAFRVMFGTLVT